MKFFLILPLLLLSILSLEASAQSAAARKAKKAAARKNMTAVIIKTNVAATIHVDGILAGESGQPLSLSEATVVIVKATGFQAKRLTIKPVPDKTTQTIVNLIKRPAKKSRRRIARKAGKRQQGQKKSSRLRRKQKQMQRQQADMAAAISDGNDMFEDKEPVYRTPKPKPKSKPKKRRIRTKMARKKALRTKQSVATASATATEANMFNDPEPVYKKQRSRKRLSKAKSRGRRPDNTEESRFLAEFDKDGSANLPRDPNPYQLPRNRRQVASPQGYAPHYNQPVYMASPYPQPYPPAPIYSVPAQQPRGMPGYAPQYNPNRKKDRRGRPIGIATPPPAEYFQ